MQGFASSKPELVQAAIAEYAGKSREEARTAGIEASERIEKFWEQAKLNPDFKGVTVYGKGLGNEEVTERYAKDEAQAQGALARLKALDEAEAADSKNELRLEAFKRARADSNGGDGNGPVDKSVLRKALEEIAHEDSGVGIRSLAGMKSPIARFSSEIYGEMDGEKMESGVTVYKPDSVLRRFATGPMTLKGAGHDMGRVFELAAGDAAIPRGVANEGGGSPTWSPRDLTRIIEGIRGQQYPSVASQIGTTMWGYEQYPYLEETSTVNDPAGTGIEEGYPTKDGIAGDELQYTEAQKTVTVRDLLVFTRIVEHMLKYDMEFVNRVEMRQILDLRRRIDRQIINGTGVEANDQTGRIQGLLENAGSTAQPLAAAVTSGEYQYGVDYIKRVRAAILKGAAGTPTFVVMNVDDWGEFTSVRTNFGMRVHDDDFRVAGMNLVPTDLIESEVCLVGDGNLATGLFGPDLEMDISKTARTGDYEKAICTVRTKAYFNVAIFRNAGFHKITDFDSRVVGTKT